MDPPVAGRFIEILNPLGFAHGLQPKGKRHGWQILSAIQRTKTDEMPVGIQTPVSRNPFQAPKRLPRAQSQITSGTPNF